MGGTSRVTLRAPDIEGPMDVVFLIMVEDGGAWKGTTTLPPKEDLVIAMTTESIVGFLGNSEIKLPGVTRLKKFSQREEFAGFDFARTEQE